MHPQLRLIPAVLAFVVASCDGGERPRVAIATNGEFADAAAFAVAEMEAEWGHLPADTIIALEALTRAAVAIESASALSERGVDAVIGHSNSAASLAAAPIYNAHEVLQLSPQSSATAYSDAGPFSFRLVPPDDRQGSFIADALRDMPGVERVVVLYVNDDYGRGLRSTLLRALGRAGPRVVGEAPHLEGDTIRVEDLDLARRVVAEADPDVIVWLGRPLILEQHLPALRSAGGDVPIIGSDAVSLAERYGETALWNNVRYVDFVDMAGTPELIDFSRRFEARFGRPATSADALTYDATRLLFEALRDGADSGPELKRWLDSLGRGRPPYQGLTGPIQFNEDGDVARSYVMRHFPQSDLPPRPLPEPVQVAP